MEFNAGKCEVLRTFNKRKNHEASYTFHGHTLTLTKKAECLGSILTPNMERPHRHDYKKGKQNLDILKAQPPLMSQISQGVLLQVPGQASAKVRLHGLGPSHQDQHQSTEYGPTQSRQICIWELPQRASVGAMLQSLG